jgi:hypothetical protein
LNLVCFLVDEKDDFEGLYDGGSVDAETSGSSVDLGFEMGSPRINLVFDNGTLDDGPLDKVELGFWRRTLMRNQTKHFWYSSIASFPKAKKATKRKVEIGTNHQRT